MALNTISSAEVAPQTSRAIASQLPQTEEFRGAIMQLLAAKNIGHMDQEAPRATDSQATVEKEIMTLLAA